MIPPDGFTENLSRGADPDPALFDPDWSRSDGLNDFWDTSHNRIVGQCRVHVRERPHTWMPMGIAGALDANRYSGERTTVISQASGNIVFRDNWKTGTAFHKLGRI